jgi:hypothetical protein
MILLLYMLNFLLAVPITLSFRSALTRAVGNSIAPAMMLPDFDFTTFADFMNIHGTTVSALMGPVLWFAFVYILLSTFLAGGILVQLQERGKPFSMQTFFSGCGLFWSRLVRLFLIFGIILLVAGSLLLSALSILCKTLTERALSETTPIIATFLMAFFFLFFVMILLLIGDYAKIILVRDNSTSMLNVTRSAWQFVFRNLRATLSLQLVLLMFPVLFTGAYLLAEGVMGVSSTAGLVVVCAMQQLFIFLRLWTHVLFLACELNLVEAIPRPYEKTVVAREGFSPRLLTRA